MTDKALEAAAKAAYDADYRVGFWAEWDEIDEAEPDNARLKNQYRAYAKAAISAYLSALPGEAEVVDLVEELREQAQRFSDPTTEMLTDAADALQAMQARAEKAERERDDLRASHNENAKLRGQRDASLALVEAAEARVKELEEALEPFARHLDEMKFDLDNHGNELPDEQTVGWVYVTNGDFRRARTALKGGSNG